jgi:hypothetical protein
LRAAPTGNPNALEQLLAGLLSAAAGLAPAERIGIVTAQPAARSGWVELTIQGVSAVVAPPASAHSMLEDHGASTEMRSGTDGSEFVLRLPLLAPSLRDAPP